MSEQSLTSTDPSRPETVVATAPSQPAADVAAAVERAATAQRAWWSGGAAARSTAMARFAAALSDAADDLIALMVTEVGKPVAEAQAEMARAVKIAEFYAQQTLAPLGDAHPPSTSGLLWHERRPHGVAGIITPWNFPIAIPLWKSLPALAAGNAVVLKPAPGSIASAAALEAVAARTLPADLFTIVTGEAETGQALVNAADVVSFTGSEAVGRIVVQDAAARMKPVQTEMGGQNAAIVLADAEVSATSAMIASAAAAFAGQKCTATRRVVVIGDDARYEEVSHAVAAAVDGLVLGDPREAGVAVGPLIDERSRDAVLAVPATVAEAGGRVLTSRTEHPATGWFAPPLVVDGLPDGHALLSEELFGPVLCVQRAADLDEAIALAEGVRYGLVTSIHGRDAGDLLRAASAVQTGMIKVNAPSTGVDYYAPFGGERDSSYGAREQGLAALDFYSSTHTVTFAAPS